MNITAKQAHGRLAVFIGLFIAVHFATHFSALGGIETHAETLGLARNIYQFPLIEALLILALALQVLLGLRLLKTIIRRRKKGFWHNAQFWSGAYIALFIVNHTGAAVITRLGFGLDTNFYWAAGTLILDPLRYGFAPYYTLAVASLVTHIIAALHFRRSQSWHAPALVSGPLIGGLIVAAYSGAFYAIELPEAHSEYFGAFPGVESFALPTKITP